jgi:hypothetical protein
MENSTKQLGKGETLMGNTIVRYKNGNVKLYETVLKTAKSIVGPFSAKMVLDLIIQQGGKNYKGGE